MIRAVVLVGPRAACKTTVGRALAAAIGWTFADGDDLVAAAVGEPAGEFLARAGAGPFRAVEAIVTLAALHRAERTVLALGGGAVLAASVREALRAGWAANGSMATVLLTAAVPELQRRLAASTVVRPSLTGAGAVDEVEAVLAARLPLYRAVASRAIDTGARDVASVVDELAALVRTS